MISKEYQEFKDKIEELKKAEEEYCRRICNNAILYILQNNDYKYDIILNGIAISLTDYKNLYIGYSLNKEHKYIMSCNNYHIETDFFTYGDCIIEENSFLNTLANMIEISKVLNK